MSQTKIETKKNGPLIVKGCARLQRASDGKSYETSETMALCRCGGSANKPLCDGAHAKNGFREDKEADRLPDKWEKYEGKEVTIHDNRGACAHAGLCTEQLKSVWRMGVEPWIDPDGASRVEIIATVRKCPSGALSYSVEGVEHRDREGEPGIFVSPNGPYVVSGGSELCDTPRGEGASAEHVTLCRCGGSKNKPFCDGTHWHNKFTDDKN